MRGVRYNFVNRLRLKKGGVGIAGFFEEMSRFRLETVRWQWGKKRGGRIGGIQEAIRHTQ